MSTSLKIAASMARDQFYQDYAPRDAFFDENDFKFHFAKIYSSMFDDMFQQVRRENRQMDGFANVEMTSQWLVRERPETKVSDDGAEFYVTTKSCVFGFSFDSFGYSLDKIKAIGKCPGGSACTVIKISADEAKFIDISPATSVVYAWMSANNRIDLTSNVDLEIQYVPTVDPNNENCVLSDNIVAKVITATLDTFFKARAGTVVDQTNDGNKNNVMQQQTSPVNNKLQQP